MNTESITVRIPFTDQEINDVLTCACEGGSNYWLSCRRAERDAELNYVRLVQPFSSEELEPFDTDLFAPGFDPRADITPATIRRGMARLFEPGILPKRPDLRGSVATGDAGNIDADAADVLLQLGYFGNLIFG